MSSRATKGLWLVPLASASFPTVATWPARDIAFRVQEGYGSGKSGLRTWRMKPSACWQPRSIPRKRVTRSCKA
jgi:hypothetical protein